jgi:transcriptional regulator with XRE-family HTH domain
MKTPAVIAPVSGPTIAPEEARLAFRQKRQAAGHSQIGLARLVGRSTAYVAHIENGRLNPSPQARAALASALGESAAGLFASFPTPLVERRAELGAKIVAEYDQGNSDAVIADLFGMSPSGVTFRRRAAGRAGRPNLATFDPGPGRITAKQAADKHGLDLRALCKAIDGRIAGGRLHEVAGRHPIRTVDERELDEYLAKRPPCGYEGCSKPAGIVSDACGGPHARALEEKGKRKSAETCRRMSAGKKGKPRPDVRERVAAMHADLEKHYRWNVAVVEGRVRITAPEKVPDMKRRAKGRLEGLLAARERGTGAPTVETRLGKTEEGKAKLEAFRQLREKHPDWGRPTLVARTGLTDSQVRALLH